MMRAIARVAKVNAARDQLLIRTMQFGLREGQRAVIGGRTPLAFDAFVEELRPDVDAYTDALNAEIVASNALAYELALREQAVTAEAARARADEFAALLRQMVGLS
jgi:hypothetical protein